MTGRWESELAEIEKGRTPHEAFLRDIEGYTRKITTELLACDKIFGNDRFAGQGKDGHPLWLQEQAGQAVQRNGHIRCGFQYKIRVS